VIIEPERRPERKKVPPSVAPVAGRNFLVDHLALQSEDDAERVARGLTQGLLPGPSVTRDQFPVIRIEEGHVDEALPTGETAGVLHEGEAGGYAFKSRKSARLVCPRLQVLDEVEDRLGKRNRVEVHAPSSDAPPRADALGEGAGAPAAGRRS